MFRISVIPAGDRERSASFADVLMCVFRSHSATDPSTIRPPRGRWTLGSFVHHGLILLSGEISVERLSKRKIREILRLKYEVWLGRQDLMMARMAVLVTDPRTVEIPPEPRFL